MINHPLDRADKSSDRISDGAGVLALYCFICVVLMVADHHGGYLKSIRQWTASFSAPLYALVDWPQQASADLSRTLAERSELEHDAAEARNLWLLAQADLARLAALERENERLRRLLDSARRVGREAKVVELLQVDLDPYSHRIVINRGSEDGAYSGQPVVDAAGIAGQVEELAIGHAVVRLITDPSHAIPVTFNRTGLRTIAYGTGRTDQLSLSDVPRSADVQSGDLLVTSGLGGRFPPGYPVAVIEMTNVAASDGFLRLSARPLAGLDTSRELLLLWPFEDEGPPRPETRPDEDAAGLFP